MIDFGTYYPVQGQLNDRFNILGNLWGANVIGDLRDLAVRDFKSARVLFTLGIDSARDKTTALAPNPYNMVLAGKVLRDYGLRLAKLSDLKDMVQSKELEYHDSLIHTDWGFVIESENEDNDYLAKRLGDSIRKKQGNIELPAYVNLADLELKLDEEAPCGLAFELAKDGVAYNAPAFKKSGLFYLKDVDKNGIPNVTHERTEDIPDGIFYKGRSAGLRRLVSLGEYFPLTTSWDSLTSMCCYDSRMRVFVVNPMRELVKRAQKERQSYPRDILTAEHELCDHVGLLDREDSLGEEIRLRGQNPISNEAKSIIDLQHGFLHDVRQLGNYDSLGKFIKDKGAYRD
jgi:hypothetical protein